MKYDVKQIKKAIAGLDYDVEKLQQKGHLPLILQRANKQQNLTFLERYLSKFKDFEKGKAKDGKQAAAHK